MDWVQQAKARDPVFAARKSCPGISRALCPYPGIAPHDGGHLLGRSPECGAA